MGLEWISIYKDIVHPYANELYYPPTVILNGINGKKIPAVFCSHYLTSGSTEELKEKLDSLYAILKEKGIKEHFLAFKGDAEDIYFGSLRILNQEKKNAFESGQMLPKLPAMEEWNERLEMVENLPYATIYDDGGVVKKTPT